MFDRIRQVSRRSPTVREPTGRVAAGVTARLATFVWIASLAMILGSNASAQFGQEQGCPPVAICHPQGAGMEFMSSMTAAADAVGQHLNQRRQQSDCSGLGVDGCIGLLATKVMCAIDGREWVQKYACAEAGGGGGGGGEGEGEAEAQSGQVQLVYTRQSGLVAGLRRSLLSHSSDAPYYSLRDGNGNGFDFFLHGVYAFDERNAGEYFATLRVVDVQTGAMTGFALGAVGEYVYLGPIDTFKALR